MRVENVKVFDMRNNNVTLLNEPTKEMFKDIPICIQEESDFSKENPLHNIYPIGVVDCDTVVKSGDEYFATVETFPKGFDINEFEFFNYSFDAKNRNVENNTCEIGNVCNIIYRKSK